MSWAAKMPGFFARKRGHRSSPILIGPVILATILTHSGCLEPTSATPYPNEGQVDFDIRSFSVEEGSTNQPLDRPLTIRFTDRVAPNSLTTDNITLSREGRSAPALLLRQDMVRCSVTLAPSEELEPGSLYRITVSDRLESWSGAHLQKERSLSFTTGTNRTSEPPRQTVSDEMVQERVFSPHCGCCHDPNQGAYAHILALDASSLVGKASQQQSGMDLVLPGSHEKSYLLLKVLGMPGVSGEPMPPPGLNCGEPWPRSRFCSNADKDLDLLSDWIFDLDSRNENSRH